MFLQPDDTRHAQWGRIGRLTIALRLTAAEIEDRAMRHLGICDVTELPKLGVKGPSASAWLAEQNLDVATEHFHTRPLPDGGLIANLSGGEFLLESGGAAESVPALAAKLDAGGDGVHRVERQDAAFLLSGTGAAQLLAQTCGMDMAQAQPQQVMMTRVAGVSCIVLPQPRGDLAVYRVWVDPSYGEYLWGQLVDICRDLDGAVVGAGCHYSNIAQSQGGPDT